MASSTTASSWLWPIGVNGDTGVGLVSAFSRSVAAFLTVLMLIGREFLHEMKKIHRVRNSLAAGVTGVYYTASVVLSVWAE